VGEFENLSAIVDVFLMFDTHHNSSSQNKEQVSVHVARKVNNLVGFIVLDFHVLKQLVGIYVVELQAIDVFLEPRKPLYQQTKFLKIVRLPVVGLGMKLKHLHKLFKLGLVYEDVFNGLFSFDAQNSVKVKVVSHELVHVSFSKGLLSKLFYGLV
jgi:hypothetical protein